MSGLSDYKTGEVPVEFAGEGAGSGDLAWGQWEIWAAIEQQGERSIGMGGVMDMPSGTRLEDFIAVLSFAMGRHHGLRTRFRCDEQGHPVEQVVYDRGEVALEVFDVPPERDAAEFADALRLEYQVRQYDYAGEWPIRMAMVRQHGVPTHAVVMYCHLIIDGFGLDALNRDMANLDRATGLATVPVAGLQPLEQVALQASPEGQRQNAAALRYWERLLRALPLLPPPKPRVTAPDPAAPRYWQGRLTSRAAHVALNEVCARTRVDSSPVLVAAFAVAVARLDGINPRVVREVFNNRFRAGFAESVSVVNQNGLLVIDVIDATFDEVVKRVWRGSLGAGMHAYFDPRACRALIEQIGRDRGEALELDCFFNDARRSRQATNEAAPDEAPPTAAELAQLRTSSRFEWLYQRDWPNGRLYMSVHEAANELVYQVCADTHHWPPAELEGVIRGVEDVLVSAATDPAAVFVQRLASSTR